MMMAKLMAKNIIKGKYTWKRVPKRMKPKVRLQLEELGHPELAE